MKKIFKILFFPLTLLLSACGLLGVKESVVIADAQAALQEKYKETFEILKVKRVMNTGGGITKSYELICAPVKDKRLEFHSTVTYDTEDGNFRMKFDTYFSHYLGKIVNEALKNTIQQSYEGDFNSVLCVYDFEKTLEHVNLYENFGVEEYKKLLSEYKKDWYIKLYPTFRCFLQLV